MILFHWAVAHLFWMVKLCESLSWTLKISVLKHFIQQSLHTSAITKLNVHPHKAGIHIAIEVLMKFGKRLTTDKWNNYFLSGIISFLFEYKRPFYILNMISWHYSFQILTKICANFHELRLRYDFNVTMFYSYRTMSLKTSCVDLHRLCSTKAASTIQNIRLTVYLFKWKANR